MQGPGGVKRQKKNPRKTMAYDMRKEHMSLHVKKQGELMSNKNQRKELNEEKGTVGNKKRWKKRC